MVHLDELLHLWHTDGKASVLLIFLLYYRVGYDPLALPLVFVYHKNPQSYHIILALC